jgi:TetR/AcrR family transcriptional regulator, cholesterol catabolism regulator
MTRVKTHEYRYRCSRMSPVTPPYPPVGRRERKKQEVERRIREAALWLFREKGYDDTTVEEISERADVAKGTFFNYFPRKDALLESLAEDVVGELFDELGPPQEWEGSARDQLLRLFVRIGDLVARDPELSRVMMVENMRRFWLRAEADPLEQEFNALVREVLHRAVADGEIDPDAEIDVSARLLEAAYVTTMIDWLKAGAPGEVYRRELTVKFDIIFRGLGMSGSAAKGSTP